MTDDFDNGRRKICVLIGSMLAGSTQLLLSSCGGGGGDGGDSSASSPPSASSPSSASSPTTTPPAAKAPDGGVAYLFDPTDSRLLALTSPAGAWGTYIGTKDSAGNPATFTSFVYEDPDSTQNFVVHLTDAEYDVLTANGERFTVIQTGSFYAFTVSDAALGKTYSGTYDPSTKTITPSSLPVTLAKSAQHNTCAYAVSKAEETTGPKQAILVKVTDQCEMVVSSGTGSATITADASSQTQQVGQELIKLPPVPVSLNFDSTQGGFYGEASLNDLNGNLKKITGDAVKYEAKILLDQIQDVGTTVAASAIVDLIPVVGEFAFVLELFRAGKVLGELGDIIEAAKTGWELGADFYQLDTSPNPAFPIDVTARYSSGAIQKSETHVISKPGSMPADFNFTIDTGVPCSNGEAIAGNWAGSLTQPNGPITDLFQFSMSFQVNGSSISGTSQIVSGPTFANMSLTGTITGDRLQFSETGITSQIAPPNGVVWCLKTGTLTLSQTAFSSTLSGSWTAISPPGCLPGAINLTKVVATS